jgi:prophage regulatory protein
MSQQQTIIRLPDVVQRTGYKRSTIYRKVRKGEMPAPIKLGDRASGWLESEINAWIESRVNATRQDGAAA